MMAKMSDEEIRQYADHLEKAAADTAMMKEIEKMAAMTPKERDQIKVLGLG
jgi:hypothetical protein